ncbi:MAG: hypothetical protein IKD76_02260 [Clostridia bacterium]|nr:hypothetical protein [Clostridia bacterium]
MEEYIDYSNSELEEKLKNVFGDTYGSLQPLIIDILLRRSYVFKISNEKTVQDAKRVLDNLDIVEFCHIHGYTLGMANPSGKSIRVREQYYNETKQYVESNEVFEDKFLATFVHELLHILSFHFETVDRKTGDIIIENCINKVNKNAVFCAGLNESPPQKLINYGRAMNEAFNEVAAGLLYNNDRDIYFSNDGGYSLLTFFPHLLSAAVGTTSNELIYAGTQSATDFNNILKRQYGVDDEEVMRKDFFQINVNLIREMEIIDKNMDMMHNLYTSGENRETEAFNTLKRSFFDSIIGNTFSMANLQISSDRREVTDNLVDELLVRYKKMDKCTVIAAEKLGIAYPINSESINSQKVEMLNRIFELYVVNSIKEKVTDKNMLEHYTNSARNGKIFEFADELENKYGIDISKLKKINFAKYIISEKYMDSPYYHKLEREDLHNYKKWNPKRNNDIVKQFFKGLSAEASKERKIKATVLPPSALIGTSFGLFPETYCCHGKWKTISKLAQDMGTTEENVKPMYEECLRLKKIFASSLDYRGKVVMQSGDKLEFVSGNCLDRFEEYYNKCLGFLLYKNASLNADFSTKEAFRQAGGIQALKEYHDAVVKEIEKSGRLSERKIQEARCRSKITENIVKKQVASMYVLVKLEEMCIHTPTEVEKNAVRTGSLFEREEEFGFKFSEYFDEKKFEKEATRRYRLDNYLLHIEGMVKKVKQLSRFFKPVLALPKGNFQNEGENVQEKLEVSINNDVRKNETRKQEFKDSLIVNSNKPAKLVKKTNGKNYLSNNEIDL